MRIAFHRQIDSKAARLPLFYAVDLVARRYGVFPPDIDLTNREHLMTVRRAQIFMSMEAERDSAIARRRAT